MAEDGLVHPIGHLTITNLNLFNRSINIHQTVTYGNNYIVCLIAFDLSLVPNNFIIIL